MLLVLVPGTVDLLVLAVIEDGALYTALHRLEKRGLLRAKWNASDANRRV